MLRNLTLYLLIFCIPLSAVFSFVGNFSILDVLIVLILVLLFAWRGVKIKREIVFPLITINIFMVIVLLFNLIFTQFNQDSLENILQFFFIFNVVVIFSDELTKLFTFQEFCKAINILAISITIIFLLGIFYQIELVRNDGTGRFLPIFAGTASIYILSLSYTAYEYLNKRSNFLIFLFYLSLALIAATATGQRSLFATCLLVLFFIGIRKHLFLTLLIIISLFLSGAFVIFFLEYSDLRIIGNLFTDSSRISVILEFLRDLFENPWLIFFGMGIEKWSDTNFSQEPHMQFLHLLSDYGLIVAIMYLFIGYKFIFKIFNNHEEVRTFSLIMLFSSLPLMLFHTYSLARGQILIFFIISAYLTSNTFFKQTQYQNYSKVG